MVQDERTRRTLGHLETLVFVLFYTLVFLEFTHALIREPSAPNALYLFDQTLILCFLLFRRPAHLVTERPLDFLLAVAGTVLPMMAMPTSGNGLIPSAFCTGLMILGLFVHLSAKLSLRRSFGVIPADRGVKSEGAYRFVRHPMYLGYMIVEIGLFLNGPQLWNGAIFAVHWMLFLYRMAAEERVLRLNPDYAAYCQKTRYKLIPGVY